MIMAVGAMLVMLLSTARIPGFKTARSGAVALSVLVVLAAGAWALMYWTKTKTDIFGGMLVLDYFSSFFCVLVALATLIVFLGAGSYLERDGIHYSEFYPLVLVCSLSMMLLAAASELLTVFMLVELMSICAYVLVGVRRLDIKSNEASVKYFIMGGVGGAILLYGVSFIYGAAGTTKLPAIASALSAGQIAVSNPLFIFGLGMLAVGFLFKIAVVPFHMWTPDVYEGAPTVVTGYMATILKAAVFAALIRVGASLIGDGGVLRLGPAQETLRNIFGVLSLATMLVGNLVALMQKNFKRMLAYSAIAHTGYLLLGIIAGTKVGYSSVALYLVAYVFMNLGAFGVLAVLSGKLDQSLDIKSFSGLAHRSPWLAMSLTVFLLSLAGMPPTAGFVGKYFLFNAAVEAGEIALALSAVIVSVVSVFYYMRVVVYMYMREPEPGTETANSSGNHLAYLAIAVCLALTVSFGLFPRGLLHAVKLAVLF